MKLFGKELFSKKAAPLEAELYDFAKHGLLRSVEHIGINDINLMEVSGDDERAENYMREVKENNEKAKELKKKAKVPKTPKEVFKLGTLNDESYTLNTSEEYIASNILSLDKKRKLLPQPTTPQKRGRILNDFDLVSESYGASKYGYEEMSSLIERLENRRKYAEYEEFFNEYPYTRSDLINNVLAEHTNLRAKRVEEFIPDMPDEAINIMTTYNDKVKELCGKKAVFYIIADKKDFGEVDKKRDPILLAQSPFSLGWQILGAWDEEMIYLGDL